MCLFVEYLLAFGSFDGFGQIDALAVDKRYDERVGEFGSDVALGLFNVGVACGGAVGVFVESVFAV